MLSRSQLVSAMERTSFFGGLPMTIRRFIADLSQVCSYDPKEAIVLKDSPSDSFFVLIEGTAVVVVDNDIEVATLNESDVFGEVGVILDHPRTATIIAKTTVVAMVLSKPNFLTCFQRFPEFGLIVSRVLANRLSNTLALIPEHSEDESLPELDIVNMLPLPLLQRFRIVPLKVEGQKMTVGFVDEVAPNIIVRMKQFLPSLDFQAVSINAEFFNKVLARTSGLGEGNSGVDSAQEEDNRIDEKMPHKLKTLLERMIGEGASDLHLSAKRKPFWRVDGQVLTIQDAAVLGYSEVFDLLSPLMREDSIKEFEETHDSDFAIALGSDARFRVNLFYDNNGIGAVLRLIPSKILSVGQLGLPSVVLELAKNPKGLVLVTGATGSGKSTTLAAMVDYLNRTKEDHIITLEDPIEFVHSSQKCLVNQREIGPHTDSFKKALRAALRQDPDIVLVGELRDRETVELALEVANTGHLVFGTLHTMNAISSIDRIIDIFPADQQNQIRSTLAEVLRGIVSQTLCKRRQGGRVAALEVLVANQAISGQIRRAQSNQIETAMQTGKALGNRLLSESLAELVRTNIITYEEGLSKAVDKPNFAKLFGKVYQHI